MGRRLALAIAGSVLLIGACAEEQPEYLAVDYESWERTVASDLTEVVPGHGGGLRRIYINSIGTDAVVEDGGAIRYPDGTIIIKEAHTVTDPADVDAPAALLGMVKAPGAEDARGGWVWVYRHIDDGIEEIFAEEYCITCHANANESHPYGEGNPRGAFRDFVFYPYAAE